MGMYLNPGNMGFQQIRNSMYVDKTGLIDFVNSTINTLDKLTCVSRPRRFGKTLAVKMLSAYYDKSCSSDFLFSDLKIASSATYKKHLNKYDVLVLDMTWFISKATCKESIVKDLQAEVIMELREAYPEYLSKEITFLPEALLKIAQGAKTRFFVIIDEWDALFREAKYDLVQQKEYIELLRSLFKSGVATDISIAGAYLTGILPIKKYGTESALTDFHEYSMVEPDMLVDYVGFTEEEVQKLCQDKKADFLEMKQWYDGYAFKGVASVYSPNSVMSALKRKAYRNYWTKTETYESLKNYISMNMDGLKDAIVLMLGGEHVKIETMSYQNDMISFKNRDDVLTLLVHLGYLAYDEEKSAVYIPNLEVSESFKLAVQDTDWKVLSNALKQSDLLLEQTLAGNTEFVVAALEKIHTESSSILQYHDENSLSCALTLAYYTARSEYIIVRELPTGKGFADLVFIPRKNISKPALIVELKYNLSADTAIRQIKEKRYEGLLKDYVGEVLLVGVNYDKKTKKYECSIERA